MAPGSGPSDFVQKKNSSQELKFLFSKKQNKEKKSQFQRRRVPDQKGVKISEQGTLKAMEVCMCVCVRVHARTMHVLLK